eukprot:1181565-Prymnesium_polylepis.1
MHGLQKQNEAHGTPQNQNHSSAHATTHAPSPTPNKNNPHTPGAWRPPAAATPPPRHATHHIHARIHVHKQPPAPPSAGLLRTARRAPAEHRRQRVALLATRAARLEARGQLGRAAELLRCAEAEVVLLQLGQVDARRGDVAAVVALFVLPPGRRRLDEPAVLDGRVQPKLALLLGLHHGPRKGRGVPLVCCLCGDQTGRHSLVWRAEGGVYSCVVRGGRCSLVCGARRQCVTDRGGRAEMPISFPLALVSRLSRRAPNRPLSILL